MMGGDELASSTKMESVEMSITVDNVENTDRDDKLAALDGPDSVVRGYENSF